jgi:hypothetical protein
MSKTEAQSSPHAPAGEEQRAAPSLIQVMRQAWRALQERAGLHGWSSKIRNPKHEIRKSYRKRGSANQGAIVRGTAGVLNRWRHPHQVRVFLFQISDFGFETRPPAEPEPKPVQMRLWE